ncbi:hypothetical protein [Butyrivibrio sp.]|jgi:hypothetical protein|uniref:hypothetical protein n=1 Tax=Butyrivibrio sp. TaxID=28121 RepID=UPI0025BC43C2|nr:hypothetical protein [Butyrivibrio sp.]
MDDCKTLKEYSLFVAKVRKCIKEEKNSIKAAITRAVDECISENILRAFLLENKEEVIEMGVLGYNAEKHMQVMQDESFDEGVKVGMDKMDELYSWLIANNRVFDIQKATSDTKYKQKLLDEFGELSK